MANVNECPPTLATRQLGRIERGQHIRGSPDTAGSQQPSLLGKNTIEADSTGPGRHLASEVNQLRRGIGDPARQTPDHATGSDSHHLVPTTVRQSRNGNGS